MIKRYQGEQFQLQAVLRDEQGKDVNPMLPTILNIKLFVVSKQDSRIYAQFSRNPQPGYITAPVVDGRLLLNMPKSATVDAPVGTYELQVVLHYSVTGATADEVIRVRKASLMSLHEAVKES